MPTVLSTAALVLCVSALCPAAAVPVYYWRSTPVAHSAQLLTLFCGSCVVGSGDQPLVAVLRDTLGDANAQNDRVTDVWLLTYSHPGIAQRVFSAVPFFYWRIGDESKTISPRDSAPLFDLTVPQHPVMSDIGRDILQWTMLDPMTTPVRATSRAYRTNQLDEERLHLEEAISCLREAPVSEEESALTQTQLDTVIARLELRKRLLGGLVSERKAARLGKEASFEEERVRSRNWELLRECAERTGLFFEPVEIGGASGEYAVIWFPLHTSATRDNVALAPIWKLLNIRDPWSDDRMKMWKGPVYARSLDANGSLLPVDSLSTTPIELVPLGVYSLTYPKMPLLLIDFRDKLHARWHEMTQRSINEITAGVIGISHFTNWYYYLAADLYGFIVARHGTAMNQAARLDAYSQFRVALALDRQLDPKLRRDMQRRVDSLAINPLETAPIRELENAKARYEWLVSEAGNGKLLARLDKQRRYELAYLSESQGGRVTNDLLHDMSLGLYTHRARPDSSNLASLDAYRRVEYELHMLDSLLETNGPPEVAYNASRVRFAVAELSDLMPAIQSASLRSHASATLARLKNLSEDERLQADCSLAIATMKRSTGAARPGSASGIAALPRAPTLDLIDGK